MIRGHVRLHLLIAKQNVEQGGVVFGPSAHEDVRLGQEQNGRHAMRDVAVGRLTDDARTHRLGSISHRIQKKRTIIERPRAARGIHQ